MATIDGTADEIKNLIVAAHGHAAYEVATTDVWVMIHAASVNKARSRRAVLDAFLDAPNHQLTFADLVNINSQYSARIYELRHAGFPIKNFAGGDRGTFFALMITPEQEKQIRRALAYCDTLPVKRSPRSEKRVSAEPRVDGAGQFLLGLRQEHPATSAGRFVDFERGVAG